MYRVIWQYSTETIGDLKFENLVSSSDLFEKDRKLFKDIQMIGQPEPVFAGPKISIRAWMLSISSIAEAKPEYDLAGFHHAFTRKKEHAFLLYDRLENTKGVVHAEIQMRPRRPLWINKKKRAKASALTVEPLTLHPTRTKSFVKKQGYLNPAPYGIDAFYAWGRVPGGKGRGIKILDIEGGWNFQHEDLRLNQGGVIDGTNYGDDHGTAALGIYSGDDNEFGIIGIANEASACAISDMTRYGRWNPEGAIQKATENLKAGDIILLEMQIDGPNATSNPNSQKGYVPIEYRQAAFSIISIAAAKGIYVIEPAGNGGENLDDNVYSKKFDRNVRDSGAIIVGAGASPNHTTPRSRLPFSNYGSRLDVQAWGEDIVTTGGNSKWFYCDLVKHSDPSRCYTEIYGGTSGSSPIVVGAVACISGVLSASGKPPLTPSEMRNLLVETGTPQTGTSDFPISQKIGPMPDLKKALQSLGYK